MQLDLSVLNALKNGQRQLDADGCEVGVSRQALDELLAAHDALASRAEPVAWMREIEDGWRWTRIARVAEIWREQGNTVTPLYATRPAPASVPVVKGLERDAEKLGRFGWHPDPAIDFETEVGALEAEISHHKIGFENGTPPLSELVTRIERAMTFRVGAVETCVAAKQRLRELEKEAASLSDATAVQEEWRSIDSAPKDGTMLRLLVQPGAAEEDGWTPFTDSREPYATIGFNALSDTLEDQWQFAGWDWCHDCFTDGAGKVIGWLPFASTFSGSVDE